MEQCFVLHFIPNVEVMFFNPIENNSGTLNYCALLDVFGAIRKPGGTILLFFLV
jgi:hypothetical protein